MRSFARHPVQLLLVTLIALELALRFVLPLPAITNFNRVDFARLWLFGGLDEVARTGGRPTEQSSYQAPQPLRNVKLSWISDPDDVDEVVTLNLYGFRGPDFEIEKAPGTQRVIFLGDSFAEGFGVADDATIPLAFERAVQEDGLEVLNLGVGGVGLPMIAALADVAIPLLSPDYVVVVVYHNDLPALPLDRDRLQAGFEPIRAQWWMPRLIESWQELVEQVVSQGSTRLVIGGKSMGGRVASMIYEDLADTVGLVCLGYPFHPPGKPERLRVEHLQRIKKPVLVIQGERDALGNRQEVERYQLPQHFQLEWLEDGDHSFKPRKASGFTQQRHLEQAIEVMAGWCKSIS